jgi:hypothetical protein
MPSFSERTAAATAADAKPAAVEVGDTLDHVIDRLGDPRVDCPLRDGVRLLIYEQGEIRLRDGRVVSCTWLTEEALESKRERATRRKKQAASRQPDTKPAVRDEKEDAGDGLEQMRERLAGLKQERSFSMKMATMHMSQTLDYFTRMVHQGGSARRQTEHLLDILPNNSLKDFYAVEFDYTFYENKYARNPSALLSMRSMQREQLLFIEEYEKLVQLEEELEQLESRIDRLERHGY